MKSTKAMRDRIRELMPKAWDDYDRAVDCVLEDFVAMETRIEALEAALRQSVDDWRKRGSRIEALEAECDRWAEQANTTAASLRTKVKTLEAALRVFADPLSWRRDGSCDPNSGRFEGQSIARAALAPEQGFSGEDAAFTARHGGGTVAAKIEPPSEEAMDREFPRRPEQNK